MKLWSGHNVIYTNLIRIILQRVVFEINDFFPSKNWLYNIKTMYNCPVIVIYLWNNKEESFVVCLEALWRCRCASWKSENLSFLGEWLPKFTKGSFNCSLHFGSCLYIDILDLLIIALHSPRLFSTWIPTEYTFACKAVNTYFSVWKKFGIFLNFL